MKRILALAILASLAAAPAMAADDDRGFYWGFDLGQFQYNLDKRALDNAAIAGIEGSGLTVLSGASDTSEDGFTWGLMGGYQFFKYLAVEAGYVDLGTAEYRANVNATDGLADYAVAERLEYDSRGFVVSALGILPFDAWSVYGRLGYYLAPSVWSWLLWQCFALVGILGAGSIPRTWSLEFMATIALLLLLIPMAKMRPMLVSALAGGATAVVLNGLPLKLGLFAAIFVGIGAGLAADHWHTKGEQA